MRFCRLNEARLFWLQGKIDSFGLKLSEYVLPDPQVSIATAALRRYKESLAANNENPRFSGRTWWDFLTPGLKQWISETERLAHSL